MYLKVDLLEKPFVLLCVVSFFRLDLGLLPGLGFQGWVSKDVLVDNRFAQGDIHRGPVEMRWL